MIVNILGNKHSVLNQYMSEIRDVAIQKDSMRFRRNIERVGEIMAYEISKELAYEKEDITKIESFSSVDKSLVSFKIQLGALRKAGANDMEEKIKDLEGVEKQGTGSGMIRYTIASFSDYSKADKYRQELVDKGFVEAFVIAVFKGEVISIQEAQELLK